jgi:hypothetical protein
VPRGGGDPSSRHKEEPGWRHAFGRRLRTLLHQVAASLRLPPAMSSSCICIAAPLSLLLPMKISNKTPIAGVVSRPLAEECWQIVSPWVWNEAPGAGSSA